LQSLAAALPARPGAVKSRTPHTLARALPFLESAAEDPRARRGAAPLMRDVWLPDTQVMVARSLAGSPAVSLWLRKGGTTPRATNHNDVGHFIVYAEGRPVLIDVGVETYTRKTFSATRYEIWTMQSQYHNLPTVNGVMQQDGRAFRASDVAYESSDARARLSLNIAGAYPPVAGLRSWCGRSRSSAAAMWCWRTTTRPRERRRTSGSRS